MNESGFPDSRADGGGATAGALLREMRVTAGVDLGALAALLKVAPRKLEALEGDRIDQLPDLMFARSLASSVCRALGADPEPVLERMPEFTSEWQTLGPGINVAFRRTGERRPSLVPSSLPRPLVVAIALLLLAAALIWLWPMLSARWQNISGAAAPVADSPSGVPASANAPALLPRPMSPTPAPPPVVVQPAAPSVAPAAAAPAPPTAQAPRATPGSGSVDDLVFVATQESWISVRDADGKSLLNRILQAGDSVAVNGRAPLAVVIGRKDAVSVSVRGQPFDHQSLSRDQVVRFEVR